MAVTLLGRHLPSNFNSSDARTCKYTGQSVRAIPMRVITVGKKRSRGIQLIVDEYKDKLQHYCAIDDVLVRSNPKNARDIKAQIEEEDFAVINLIKSNDWVVVLDEHGQDVGSERLAELIGDAGLTGASRMIFCIGGPSDRFDCANGAIIQGMDYSQRPKISPLEFFWPPGALDRPNRYDKLVMYWPGLSSPQSSI